MSRSLLILGITGELGSRVAQLAIEANYQVFGVSRGLNDRSRADLKGVQIFYGSKLDRDFMQDLGGKLQPDIILDTIPSRDSLDNIREFFPGVKNVFQVSSTGTFVPLNYFPADENHPWQEENEINFHVKIAVDKYSLELFRTANFPVTIFRPTNIIGAGRVPLDLYGGRDIEFFRALKESRDLVLPDCREILLQSGCNWDLAKAMFLAMETPRDIRGEIFVISTARAIRLADYLNEAIKYFNSKSRITWVDPDEFQAAHPEHTGLPFLRQHMCFSIEKARTFLGYTPEYTTQSGLIEALKWCEEQALI